MRQYVLARRIVDADRRVAHDRRKILVVDRVDGVGPLTNSDCPELARVRRLDDAVDVLALVGGYSSSLVDLARIGHEETRTGSTTYAGSVVAPVTRQQATARRKRMQIRD